MWPKPASQAAVVLPLKKIERASGISGKMVPSDSCGYISPSGHRRQIVCSTRHQKLCAPWSEHRVNRETIFQQSTSYLFWRLPVSHRRGWPFTFLTTRNELSPSTVTLLTVGNVSNDFQGVFRSLSSVFKRVSLFKMYFFTSLKRTD